MEVGVVSEDTSLDSDGSEAGPGSCDPVAPPSTAGPVLVSPEWSFKKLLVDIPPHVGGRGALQLVSSCIEMPLHGGGAQAWRRSCLVSPACSQRDVLLSQHGKLK